MPFFDNFFGGSKGKIEQAGRYTPEQNAFLQQLLEGLMGGGKIDPSNPLGASQQSLLDVLSDDPAAIERYNAPLTRQYNEEIIPNLATQFGGAGSLSSSAFRNSLTGSAKDLTQRLGENRQQQKFNAIQQLMGMGQMGLGAQSFENIYKPGKPGFFDSFLGGIGGGLGQGIGGGLFKGGGSSSPAGPVKSSGSNFTQGTY